MPETQARIELRRAANGERVVGFEAKCGKCGETFNPTGDEQVKVIDLAGRRVALFEHYMRFGPDEQGNYETDCGGFGPLVGYWR